MNGDFENVGALSDHLPPKPARRYHGPAKAGNSAGRGRFGVAPGHPLGSGHNRCEWHVGGTAGEDDFAHLAPSAIPLTVGCPLSASLGRCQAAKAARRSD